MKTTASRKRRWPLFVLVAILVAIATVVTMFFTGTSIEDIKDRINPPATISVPHTDPKPIGTDNLKPEDVLVSGAKVPTSVKATKAAASVKSPYKTVETRKQLNSSSQEGTDAYLEELSPILEIGPSGKLPAPMMVSIKLDRKVSITPAKQGQPQDRVFIITNATHKPGGWKPVEAQISADGWYATVPVNHLSWFQALWTDVTGMWNELKEQFLDGMTSGVFASAKKPTCRNEQQARSEDYRITSSSKNTIYWCFGVEKNERIVRIVNNRKYPLEVKTNNLTKIDHDTIRLEFVDLLRAMGKQFLMPGDSMTYKVALKHDGKATIDTDISKSALGVHSVETIAKSLVTLIAKIDTSKPGNVAEMIKAIAKDSDCLGVLGTMNMGDLINKCFNKEFLFKNFGPQAVFLAPVMAVFAIASVGQSLWDAYNDGKNGQATYNVTVTRPKPNPFRDILLPDGQPWHVHGFDMWVNPDGTARVEWHAGPCSSDPFDTNTPMCTGYSTYKFVPIGNGKFRGTVLSKWFTTDSGLRYDYDDSGGREIGDTFTIGRNAENGHFLDWVWDDSSNNSSEKILCDPYAAQRNDRMPYQKCGA